MKDEIRLMEELAMNAWPAELVEPLDGWRIRWHRMASRRVNSVWPNDWDGQVPLAIKLEKVELFYTLRGQPARYQICPAALPDGLDEVLETRGYTVDGVTAVQVVEVPEVLARIFPSPPRANTLRRPLPAGERGEEVKIFETLTDEWLEGYCLMQEAGVKNVPSRREALGRVVAPGVYVLVCVNGEAAAVGRGVLERGWLGVFGMSIRREFRRRGYATEVLGTLAGWAQLYDAEKMYLQVLENNPGAKALYEKVGFETLYHYHYRESPH